MNRHSDSLRKQLIRLLASGRVRSGADLAQRLELSRTAVWKHIDHLRARGLNVEAVPGRGYRLCQPVELLQKKKVSQQLSKAVLTRVRSLELLFETDSTNQVLTERLDRSSIHGHVVLAEYQSRGRGRRGNVWISPMAGSINLSLGWHYEIPPQHPGCLSLAMAVGVMKVLQDIGIEGAGLKWPNDIFANDRKLGGILVEMRGENAGPVDVIVGLGLNINSAMSVTKTVGQSVTDIAELTRSLPSRNQLAGALINELVLALGRFPDVDVGRMLEAWRRYDCARGKWATIQLPDRTCSGEVLGIDDQGLLQMRIDDQLRTFTSGQVSLAVHH